MKNKDLIAELQELDPEVEVIVWEGYDAGCTTKDIEINTGTFYGTKEKYYLLEG
jgi:hypothetical protein